MKVVIDINEETYTRIKTALIINAGNTFYNTYRATCTESMLPSDVKNVVNAIKNGTPLPKGHGELIDKEVVLDMMNHGILEEYITVMGGVIPADQ